MRYAMRTLVVTALLLPLAGTTTSAQGNPPKLDTMKVVEQRKEPRTARNMLTLEELESKSFQTVYDAIESMRPFWLRPRGPTHLQGTESAATPVKVYLDNVHIGGVDELKGMPIRTVKRITFLSGPEAQQRYGVGNENGVILAETIGLPIHKDP